MNHIRELAEVEAIHVFAGNLKDLLLAAPARARPAEEALKLQRPFADNSLKIVAS